MNVFFRSKLRKLPGAALCQLRSAIGCQTERTLLLSTILLLFAVSWATGFVLARYYSVDVLSNLGTLPKDCWEDWGMRIGTHCFSDYPVVGKLAARPNPWEMYWIGVVPSRIQYSAAGMVPYLFFWNLGNWLGAPQLVLVIVVMLLAVAVMVPAIWAARGARGTERVVVFLACGVLAFPVWMVIDRGNSVGLVTPLALIFLVALSRRRWGLVAIVVVLAALVKPQFAALAVALLGARQWRLSAATIIGVVSTNLGAYLLWPRDFPATIGQSFDNLVHYTTTVSVWAESNVSFANGVILPLRKVIRAAVGRDGISDASFDSAGGLVGYGILVAVVASVVILGRRIDPVMAGIVLLATASLFPAATNGYYLVFVLAVAALVVRDPDGPPQSGIFDRLAAFGDRRRTVGICVSLAVAVSIVQIALPFPPPRQVTNIDGSAMFVHNTLLLTPLAWLIACTAIIVSYARKSARLTSE
ncbi:hypothetical protein MycrhDRAFT_3436 [Mycolicibacterium rhodesiae JS60]|nr:hypothetical protein MycrhDRAFT_3436 [Mycolicibacterium rhodesiae JS60]